MIDGYDFIKDSLFCEWGYIVNLDEEVLEVYRGFQEKPHDRGRYASYRPPKQQNGFDRAYYACALLGSIPFGELDEDTFYALIEREVGED